MRWLSVIVGLICVPVGLWLIFGAVEILNSPGEGVFGFEFVIFLVGLLSLLIGFYSLFAGITNKFSRTGKVIIFFGLALSLFFGFLVF